MSDKSLREKYEDEPRLVISRRWFIQGAVAAVGAVGLTFGQDKSSPVSEKPVINDGFATGNCDCTNEAALPLMAAAKVGVEYFGLAGTESGPFLYSLAVAKDNGVSLGSPLKLDMPTGFIFGSLGVARGGLIVTGGLPFVLDRMEVDYELTEDVRAAMDNDVPAGIPTSGRQTVEMMGVEPAVFTINGSTLTRMPLPNMPKRSFAVATASAETGSGVALLIEHSDGVNESSYASAIDLIHERGGSWSTLGLGKDLGESGPNFLVASGEDLIAGINTENGSFLVNSARDSVRKEPVSGSGRILSLVEGNVNPTALLKEPSGRKLWSPIDAEGQLTGGSPAVLENDDIVGIASVVGSDGQAILLGRRRSQLIEHITLSSKAAGGDRYVM